MSFYEQQLRWLTAVCGGISNPVYAGRACYGDLGADNRVKLQFVTQGYADHYDALKATVLNRGDGVVDSLLLRFSDVWGKKYDAGYHNGVPHIWQYNGKHEWYGYTPTEQDLKVLAGSLDAYLGVFAVRAPERDRRKEPPDKKASMVQKVREGSQNGTPRAGSTRGASADKSEPEL